MIVPILLLVIGVLTWHSIFSLQRKVGRNESKWYVFYGIIAAIYIPFSPFLLIQYASEQMGFSNSLTAYIGIIVAVVIFILFINNTNKIHQQSKSESS